MARPPFPADSAPSVINRRPVPEQCLPGVSITLQASNQHPVAHPVCAGRPADALVVDRHPRNGRTQTVCTSAAATARAEIALLAALMKWVRPPSDPGWARGHALALSA